MRNALVIILIISKLLFSNDENQSIIKNITLYQKIKENNNSKIITLKRVIFNRFNSLMPSYLQIEPKENFLDLKLIYDPLKNKTSTQSKINVILPSFERSVQKINQSTKKTTKKTYSFKITPFFTMYKSSFTLVIKPSFTYKVSIEKLSFLTNSFAFDETIYFYTFQKEYKEISIIYLNKIIKIKNLTFKASKTTYSENPTKMYYDFGFYYYDKNNKNIKVYGLWAGGESREYPFLQSYKLFFTFRQKLFNKNYLFIELTPYFLAHKDWHYTPKFFITTTLNFKF
ncbi:hypothetical protein JCM11957_01240 [Caminibacter profundus]